MQSFTFRATARDLAVMLSCAAESDVRYYLNGMLVEVGTEEGRMVSTDGHRLMVGRLSIVEGEGSAILPREFMRECIGQVKGSRLFDSYDFEIKVEGMAVSTFRPKRKASQTEHITANCIDGRFPNWRQVIPAKTSGERAHFDAAYIADFDRTAALLAGKDKAFAVIAHNGSASALVDIGGLDRFVAVLMPMRGCDEACAGSTPPEWIGEPITAPAEKIAA